jgi:hypothetical protein
MEEEEFTTEFTEEEEKRINELNEYFIGKYGFIRFIRAIR